MAAVRQDVRHRPPAPLASWSTRPPTSATRSGCTLGHRPCRAPGLGHQRDAGRLHQLLHRRWGRLGLSDEELQSWFADRHLLLFLYQDGPSDVSQLFPVVGSGAINTGSNTATPVAVPDYPGSGASTSFRTKVVSFMWPEGTWLGLTTGELTSAWCGTPPSTRRTASGTLRSGGSPRRSSAPSAAPCGPSTPWPPTAPMAPPQASPWASAPASEPPGTT